MPPSTAYLFGVAFIIPFRAALAQTTHNVTVGAQGSFYDPPTVSAALNDTVNFIFVGPVHSVVQAAFNNPCSPLPGGFSSGLVKRDESGPPPIWSLKITNVTFGIWFYCENTIPVPHCASGMVGAINPSSQASYQQFVDNAKFVVSPPPQVSLALTGQGAFATNSAAVPTAMPSVTTTPSLTSYSVTSSSTNDFTAATTTPPPTAAPKSTDGTIIGGAVAGGVVGLILITILALLLFRRRKRRQRRGSKDFFRYKAQTPTLGGASETFLPSKLVSPPTDRSRTTQLPPSSYSSPTSQPSTLAPQRFSPAARPSELVGAAAPALRKNPTGSPPARRVAPPVLPTPPPPPPTPSATATAPVPPPPPPAPPVDQKVPTPERDAASPNIHVLAREVAAVLLQSPQQPAGAQPSNVGNRTSSSVNSLNRTESPAPPRYRASVL